MQHVQTRQSYNQPQQRITAMPQTSQRGLPSNIAAEEALVGHVILYPQTARQFAIVQPEWFYRAAFEMFWSTLQSLLQEDKQPDLWIMEDHFRRTYGDEMAESVMDACRTAEMRAMTRIGDPETWVMEVREAWQSRAAIKYAAQIAQMAAERDFEGLRATTYDMLRVMQAPGTVIQTQTIAEGMEAMLDEVAETMTNPEAVLFTGMPTIDNWTGGFRRGDLITITGQSGMGKSATVLSIVINIAQAMVSRALENAAQGITELPESIEYFTFDMSTSMQCMRAASQLMCDELGVDINSLLLGFRYNAAGDLDIQGEPDHEQFAYVQSKLMARVAPMGQHVYFHQIPTTVEGIVNILREAKRTRRPRMAVIDQTENVVAEDNNRINHFNGLVTGLKAAAKSENIPVLMLHQLNREASKTKSHIPEQEQLRESGQVGNASDIIMAPYCPNYYWPDRAVAGDPFTPNRDWYKRGLWIVGIKHRMGARSSADRSKSWMYMRFVAERTMITECPDHWNRDEFMEETMRVNGESAARGDE